MLCVRLEKVLTTGKYLSRFAIGVYVQENTDGKLITESMLNHPPLSEFEKPRYVQLRLASRGAMIIDHVFHVTLTCVVHMYR